MQVCVCDRVNDGVDDDDSVVVGDKETVKVCDIVSDGVSVGVGDIVCVGDSVGVHDIVGVIVCEGV